VNTNTDHGVEGLGFDASSNLYVTNFNNTASCILEKFAPSGGDRGPFEAAVCYGVAFDGEGNVYSAASDGPIEKFSPSGGGLGGFGVGSRDLGIVPGPITKDPCKKGCLEYVRIPEDLQEPGRLLFVRQHGSVRRQAIRSLPSERHGRRLLLTLPRPHATVGGPEPRPARGECA
jgi:hypothetical protein